MTRQGVIDAVKTAVRTTGVQAYEWLAAGLTPQSMPAVIIRDKTDDITASYQQSVHSLAIELVCLTSSGATTLTDCRTLMDTIAQAVTGGVDGAEVVGSDLAVEHDEHVIAAGTVSVSVRYLSGLNQI